MGFFSRDIAVEHLGHEIALSVVLKGSGFSVSGNYKLYIDGQVVDQQEVPGWASLVGGKVTLRGQLEPTLIHDHPLRVTVIANLYVLKRNDYQILVEDKQIHHELATYGGV